MSIDHTQLDDGLSTASTEFEQRLNRWRGQLDAFAATFEAEITEILEALETACRVAPSSQPELEDRSLQVNTAPAVPALSEDRTRVPLKQCEETIEFTMPELPVTDTAVTTQAPPVTDAEPNRFAALKAKLSRQMASTSQPATTRTPENPQR